jgi:hypothetical protein
MANQYTPAEERFWARVQIARNGCWFWTGYKTDGRPRFNIKGRPTSVYRWAYKRFRGRIPKGKMVCHQCNNPGCVNPAHLYAGTHRDNAMDSVAIGTHWSQRYPERARENARKLGKRNSWSRGRLIGGKIPKEAMRLLPQRIDAGETLSSIASQFNVSKQAVKQAADRQRTRAALERCKE